ncbi:MAG TPA: hypothetical protein DCP90_01880 [Clostridiales bacterium]|nr:MAG: hypothetical protein A2Y22_08775 [Clostridiales bacterium GWD2_32_59]HAN09342.1 hypothetical protein [Clostridiales bacterium]
MLLIKMLGEKRKKKMLMLYEKYNNIVATEDSFVTKTAKEESRCYIIRCHVLSGTSNKPDAFILRLIVITHNGVSKGDIFLSVNGADGIATITDIRIMGNNINKGYGSILIKEALEIIKKVGYLKVNGEISGVDWDHIDRLKAFYKKHGFEIKLDYEMKKGSIEKVII